MKKKLMIILVAAFLGGSLGLNAQVVNTDVPTEEEFEEEESEYEEDEEEGEDDEENAEELSEDEFAVTDQEGNEEVIEFPEAMTYDLDSLLNLYTHNFFHCRKRAVFACLHFVKKIKAWPTIV